MRAIRIGCLAGLALLSLFGALTALMDHAARADAGWRSERLKAWS